MVSQVVPPKDGLKSLAKGHGTVFRRAQKLLFCLTHLRYEGRSAFEHNLRGARDLVKTFRAEWVWYVDMEENIILNFLEVHVPRLEADIRFFRLEHDDLKDKLKRIEQMLLDLSEIKHALARGELVRKLEDAITYWFCLLKQHVNTEHKTINSVVREELKPVERAKLQRLIAEQLTEKGGG